MTKTVYIVGLLLLTAIVALSLPSQAAAVCSSLKDPGCPGVVCKGYDQVSRTWTNCVDGCFGRSDCCDAVPPDEFYCP
jgi:hypothetical protein